MLSPSSLGGNIAWLTARWPVIGFLCEPVVFGKSYQCDYFGQELKKSKNTTKKPTTKNHQPTRAPHGGIPGVNSAVAAQKLLLSAGVIRKRETWLRWHCDKLGVCYHDGSPPKGELFTAVPTFPGQKK